MDKHQIYQMIETDPETQEEAVLQAYQLGRLLGRAEGAGHVSGQQYEDLCELVAGKTAALAGRSFVAPVGGCNVLKRESIVRALQHRELAVLSGKPTDLFDVSIVLWLITHIPPRLLRIAAEYIARKGKEAQCSTSTEPRKSCGRRSA